MLARAFSPQTTTMFPQKDQEITECLYLHIVYSYMNKITQMIFLEIQSLSLTT